jgi:hypothetical protein
MNALDEGTVLVMYRAAAERLALEVRELRDEKEKLEQQAGDYGRLLDAYNHLVCVEDENKQLVLENERLNGLIQQTLANANTVVDSPVTEILDPAETQILDDEVMYGLVSAEPEKKPRSCRNCGESGHDNRNCPTRKTKRVRRCGNCGQTGHDKRKCSI